MHNYNMYSVINHVVNLYGLKAISIHSCCTFNMSMGVMCVLQSWVLPMYCITTYPNYVVFKCFNDDPEIRNIVNIFNVSKTKPNDVID